MDSEQQAQARAEAFQRELLELLGRHPAGAVVALVAFPIGPDGREAMVSKNVNGARRQIMQMMVEVAVAMNDRPAEEGGAPCSG